MDSGKTNSSVSTLSFFKYEGFRNKIWAFGMMQYAHAYLAETPGLSFYKLMGTGKNEGFNPLPDWSTYTLLCVWESEEDARAFYENSNLIQKYRAHTEHEWTLYLKTIMTKGEWSGKKPFLPHSDLDKKSSMLAVITRASIRPRRLYSFWKYVPTSHLSLHNNPGLIFTKGVGEVPVLQMATFSLWKDKESLLQFAYQSKEHHKAIQKTRELDWYSEEMFTRFQVYKVRGAWPGVREDILLTEEANKAQRMPPETGTNSRSIESH